MRNKHVTRVLVWVLGLGLCAALSASPVITVTHAPQSLNNLESSWDWAFKAASQKAGDSGFYIGYMIEQDKNTSVYMGKDAGTSLYEIIYGKKRTGELTEKEVAILFRFEEDPKNRRDFSDVDLNSLNHPADLDKVPLFWLGRMQTNESITFLKECFQAARTDKNRKHLVAAVGIHGPNKDGFLFLKKVLAGDYATKVREQCAFWIGQQQSAEAAKVLLDTVYNDRSQDVREHAVFGLYLVKRKEADDALVKLAKYGKEKEIRKKAIFWLGQKAAEHTEELLADIAANDTDDEIQEAAVFAISRQPNGVSKLIDIADTHRSLSVRKHAIFWLSQSKDPRALDKILSILEK